MTHDAFLRSILETPDDDAPRLVYADWLEENGDPLGPFLRVQCRLAALADDDPRRWLLVADEARLDAELRQALGARPRPAWAAKVPAWALLDRWGFARGMIGRLSTTAAKYANGAAALHRAAPVQHLHLRNMPRYLGAVFAREELRHVRALDLSGNKLAASGARALCDSPHVRGLKELDLRACRLRVAEATRVASTPALATVERLRLGGNQLYDAGAEAILASPHLTRLRELNLEGTQLGPRGARALAQSATLERLRLGGNHPGDEGVRRLAGAEGLQRLTHLDLSHNQAHSGALAGLLTSVGLPALTHLDLSGNFVGEELFATAPSRPRQGRLRLRLAGPDEIPPAALGDSPLIAACVGLDLGPAARTAAHVRALVGSAAVAGLRSLAIGGPGVMEDAVAALAASPHLTGLDELSLVSHRWTNRMVATLLDAPLLRRLKHLRLGNDHIAEKPALLAARAGELSHLERLTILLNFSSWSTVEASLRDALGWRLRVE